MGSHTGTHVDAPRHFFPESAGVDATPLDYLIGPCQVVDCRGLKSVSLHEVADLDVAAAPRVLFRTDNSERLAAQNEFFADYVAVEEEAARWLVEHGALLVGVDGLSIRSVSRAESRRAPGGARSGQGCRRGTLPGRDRGRALRADLPAAANQGLRRIAGAGAVEAVFILNGNVRHQGTKTPRTAGRDLFPYIAVLGVFVPWW